MSVAYIVLQSTVNSSIDVLCIIVGVSDRGLGILNVDGNFLNGLGTKYKTQGSGEDGYSSYVVEELHCEDNDMYEVRAFELSCIE